MWQDNCIFSLETLSNLYELRELQCLRLKGNPVALHECYVHTCIDTLPALLMLDGKVPSTIVTECSCSMMRQSYVPVQVNLCKFGELFGAREAEEEERSDEEHVVVVDQKSEDKGVSLTRHLQEADAVGSPLAPNSTSCEGRKRRKSRQRKPKKYRMEQRRISLIEAFQAQARKARPRAFGKRHNREIRAPLRSLSDHKTKKFAT